MTFVPHTHPTHEPVLATGGLAVHFGNRSALEDVDISIRAGDVVALLGPNGAGKSTLLKVMAGMVPPSHGSCTFHGQEIRGPHPSIVYVPQRSGADWTFPISVLDSVMLGSGRDAPRWRRFGPAERARAMQALRSVEMDTLAGVQIGSLSGGQQQRVFLARALLAGGDVLLLDEPFTGVDIPTQDLFVTILHELLERGVAVAYATHDLEQARRTANQFILLNRRVIATGTREAVFTPALIHQAFGGRVLVLDARQDAPEIQTVMP